jgi:hypothetical protein
VSPIPERTERLGELFFVTRTRDGIGDDSGALVPRTRPRSREGVRAHLRPSLFEVGHELSLDHRERLQRLARHSDFLGARCAGWSVRAAKNYFSPRDVRIRCLAVHPLCAAVAFEAAKKVQRRFVSATCENVR